MTADKVRGPVIRVQGLQKSYKELQVLCGVDFDVARGGIFALLGSNGAGKTTVVKILSTLLKADAGTASVNGFDVATQPANVRESISLTGQFAAVDEILSGRENLVLVARLRHLKDPGKIADDLLKRFSLTDAGARKVSTYSGGMRRRLDIAMSLVGNPPVIFLDEPTTGLDPQGRIEVWHAVKQIAQLTAGDSLALPPEVTSYLDRLRQIGASERLVEHERDGWILVAARWPDRIPEIMRSKFAQLDDPQLVRLYRVLSELLESAAGSDDPRLEEAVDIMAGLAEQAYTPGETNLDESAYDEQPFDLLDALAVESDPRAQRLLDLMRERGWARWTRLDRLAEPPD